MGNLRSVAIAAVFGTIVLGQARQADAGECLFEAACKTACDGGDAEACTDLGRVYLRGRGVPVDAKRALAAFEKGCPANGAEAPSDLMACYEAAALLEPGWMFDVPADPGRADEYRWRIRSGGVCGADATDRSGSDCLALAREQFDMVIRYADDYRDRQELGEEVVTRLSRACTSGSIEACEFLLDEASRISYSGVMPDDSSVRTAQTAAEKSLVGFCNAGDAGACLRVVTPSTMGPLTAPMTKACAAGDPRACFVMLQVNIEKVSNLEEGDPVWQKVLASLHDVCAKWPNSNCAEVGQEFTQKSDLMVKLGAYDVGRGRKILRAQCDLGMGEACAVLAEMLAQPEEEAKLPADLPGALRLAERACSMTQPVSLDGTVNRCEMCAKHPEAGECQRRDTYALSRDCQRGTPEACESLGDRYAQGVGIDKSAVESARSYKNACDGSVKGACAKLDALCRDTEGMSEDLCSPSLLHTDVFYEAEWQFRQTQTATLVKGTPAEPAAAGAVTLVGEAGGGSGPGVRMTRGSLDADLVVSIVLDRARQAALRLVVDELTDRMGQRGIRTYMRDLLRQGANLLADSTNLRRDALQDLGMTLVRAFAASNLVRTQLGDVDAVLRAKVIGVAVKDWRRTWLGDPAGKLEPILEAYLADLAYWALGGEPLFAYEGAAAEPAPACPYDDARRELCDVFAKREKVLLALRVDGVLAALNMARALGTEGGIDVRRLIEAVAQSKAIVDFAATPGLNLYAWRSRIVEDLRYKLGTIRDRLAGIERLLDPESWADKGPNLDSLAQTARQVREFFEGADKDVDARVVLGADVNMDLSVMLRVEEFVNRGFGQAVPTEEEIQAFRAEARAAIERAASTWRKTLQGRIDDARGRIEKLTRRLDDLGRKLTSITATLETHQEPGNDHGVRLRIDRVPLADLDQLADEFPSMVEILEELDDGLRDLVPRLDLRGVRFARSSAVRLLGFLDLMSRVARAGGINQTVRDVVDTLQLLGRWKKGEFAAPLYDMLQPVLAVIETRTPMPLEQLFAIVGRVRLDGLVTSLALGEAPCREEDRAECWVFKLAYALQESITRTGDAIKIDGAEVAKRLAQFGDDFRRRNKGRWYLHLTVGAGTMWSRPPATMTGGLGDGRIAPMISEQIGFGWATPAFWKDRLTFKVGLSGSGLLYRAVLDNAESQAVIGNAFVALDVYDVIEAYAAFNVLAYPPGETGNASIRPGFSVGLSVPLSAYLERL